MTTYIWLQQALFAFFNIWNIDKEIEEQCRLGDIATELVKPISLYSIWHAKSLAKKTAMVSLRALPILIVAMMPFLGQYQIMAPKSALSLVLSIIAMILSVLVMISFIMIMYGVILKTVTSNGIKNYVWISDGLCVRRTYSNTIYARIYNKHLKIHTILLHANVTFNIYNGYISSAGEIIKILILQVCWIILLTYIGKRIINKQIAKVVVQGG